MVLVRNGVETCRIDLFGKNCRHEVAHCCLPPLNVANEPRANSRAVLRVGRAKGANSIRLLGIASVLMKLLGILAAT